MKPVDDGLFAHIKESLQAHEEAYKPGAWERFEKKERKKVRWLWVAGLSSAAALLLVGFTLFYLENRTPHNTVHPQVKIVPGNESTPKVNGRLQEMPKLYAEDERLKNKVLERTGMLAQKGTPRITAPDRPSATTQAVIAMGSSSNFPAHAVVIVPDVVSDIAKKEAKVVETNMEGIAKAAVPTNETAEGNKAYSFQEFLEAEAKSARAASTVKPSAKKIDKWEMGLMVVPSVGNTRKLNMGYGLSMDYALSAKVSISSGISYNEMAATKSVGGNGGVMDAPTSMGMVSDTKSLKSVDANLVGIDIPVGIKYYVSKKFYTNVGISAFAVLNQKQSNNYLQGSVEYSAPASATNASGFKAIFQQQTVSEAVPEGEIRGDKYLGFYNLSFGFKQPISGNKAFSVEPFMKLPMKEFTKENLYLLGTGVRLKFDF